jgi:hypothetical protein
MAHYKRKGPKSTRAGCLLCKPQKRQGAPLKTRRKFSEMRGRRIADEKISEASSGDKRRGLV